MARTEAVSMSVSSGGPGSGPSTSDRPKKLQRISQACDLCHRRSIRCRPSTENPQYQCQNCYDFGVDCTYKRPSRRRRNPSVSGGQPAQPNVLPNQQQSSNRVCSPSLLYHLCVTNTCQRPSHPASRFSMDQTAPSSHRQVARLITPARFLRFEKGALRIS